MNYYNENDPKIAHWLRNLIEGGMIPAGEVDDRSIKDVSPIDLKGYTQHHFFAGVGGWSEALRLAAWPQDRPVWTGSCPCQSFSAAGMQNGFNDPRHLWPVWYELIRACKPPVIFGEQVSAAIKHGWLDLVSDDLERENYAFGAVVLPACSVGAPHIRQRLWFMAYRSGEGLEGRETIQCADKQPVSAHSLAGMLGNADINRSGKRVGRFTEIPQTQRTKNAVRACPASEIVNDEGGGLLHGHWAASGFWGGSDWVLCTDGAARPVEPGTLPLAHGVQNRVVKIRGYGNAIVPQVAAEVIKAGMEYLSL